MLPITRENGGRSQAQEHALWPGGVEVGVGVERGRGAEGPYRPAALLGLPHCPSLQRSWGSPPNQLSKLVRRHWQPKQAWEVEEDPVQAVLCLLAGRLPTHSPVVQHPPILLDCSPPPGPGRENPSWVSTSQTLRIWGKTQQPPSNKWLLRCTTSAQLCSQLWEISVNRQYT